MTRDPDQVLAEVLRALDEPASPAAALAACSDSLDAHGVESVTLATGEQLLYVNQGDTYDATLCHLDGRGFFVASWGDVAEEAEQRRAEDTGERRCGYCGEWSEPGDRCGSCGRDPSTGEPVPEPLRHVRLDTGHSLRTWDTGRRVAGPSLGRTRIGYELRDPSGVRLFRGEDFGPSPLHADDSDATLRALLGFLTLRPGDTDADYFDGYSPEQLAFAGSSECEQLQWLYAEDGPGAFVELDGDGTTEDGR